MTNLALLAILIWFVIGWGAYRELTALSRPRSALAFVVFCLLCLPILFLSAMIGSALSG